MHYLKLYRDQTSQTCASGSNSMTKTAEKGANASGSASNSASCESALCSGEQHMYELLLIVF